MGTLDDLLKLGREFVREALSPEPIDRETVIDDMDDTLEELALVKRKLKVAEAQRDATRRAMTVVYERLHTAERALREIHEALHSDG